jgi:hypothetical protein
VQREVTLNDATAASNYGQLLEACDRRWTNYVFLGEMVGFSSNLWGNGDKGLNLGVTK